MKLPRKANWLFIFQTGYGFIQLPLGLFSFATTIYYLLVNNVPWLKTLFPRFEIFCAIGVLIGVPVTMIIGQIYIRSQLNKASTRLHPYSDLLIPAQVKEYEAIVALCRVHSIETPEMDELIARSKAKW